MNIDGRMSVDNQMSQLLADMRALRSDAMARDVLPSQDITSIKPTTNLTGPSFGDSLKNAIAQVNKLQNDSSELKVAYEMNDPKVDITQVMVASEKASIAFTAVTQIRNKFVDAYRDIMNMPI